ncbi:MAG: MnmC family methyltransferase [Campylobacterota bacterium]|nr:MnmC family methyltransferase [Campylobacterota bacterium]
MRKTDFNDKRHEEVRSDDGSYTAYSKEYEEHYHSTKDGALKESYEKHVIPAFKMKAHKKELYILDICYGLGFNTLCTLLFYKENAPDTKLNIYSPELDEELIKSLKHFSYPKEFEGLKEIIVKLSEDGVYEDDTLYIELFLGDAREYLRALKERFFKEKKAFDIVYQDAFSPSANPTLWTKEYFADIKELVKNDAILTTYSIALQIRLGLYENGFYIYLSKVEGIRPSTLASLSLLDQVELVDMEHKISCNKSIKPLSDRDL